MIQICSSEFFEAYKRLARKENDQNSEFKRDICYTEFDHCEI